MKAVRSLIFSLIVVFASVVAMRDSVGLVNSHADAAVVCTEFEKTDVMSDLKSMDGFSLIDHPYDPTGVVKRPEIINVVEYCYSPRTNLRGNYGVYVYFYDPQARQYSQDRNANKITLATSWESIGGELIPKYYEKFELKLCSVSDGDHSGLFYKYKIIDRKSPVDGKTMVERVNSSSRRYDISEIELRRENETTSTSYAVGASCCYTGYASGYGPNMDAESSLACSVTPLTTLRLDIISTLWRSASSSVGPNYYNQLNSVYFAVPEEYFAEGFTLRKIHAEWYEYGTGNIYTSTDAEFAAAMGDHDNPDLPKNRTDWGIRVSDPKSDVTTEMLTEYINTHKHGESELEYLYAGKNIPKCLFDNYLYRYEQSSLCAFRTEGYNDVTIDAGDYMDLLSYDDTHSFWDKVHDYGWFQAMIGAIKKDESHNGIEPIHIVTASDLSGDIAANCYISDRDVSEFKTFYETSKAQKQKAVLFRFASTDYYSAAGAEDHYRINRTVMFFDFDIIDLTFDNGEITKVVPVAASPIDIIGDLQFPNAGDSDARSFITKLIGTVLSFLLVLLLILLLSKTGLLKYIVDFVVWVITLPVKAIKAIFKRKQTKAPEAPPVSVSVNVDRQTAELARGANVSADKLVRDVPPGNGSK